MFKLIKEIISVNEREMLFPYDGVFFTRQEVPVLNLTGVNYLLTFK